MKQATRSETAAGEPDTCAGSFTFERPVGGFGTTGNTSRLLKICCRGSCAKYHIGY